MRERVDVAAIAFETLKKDVNTKVLMAEDHRVRMLNSILETYQVSVSVTCFSGVATRCSLLSLCVPHVRVCVCIHLSLLLVLPVFARLCPSLFISARQCLSVSLFCFRLFFGSLPVFARLNFSVHLCPSVFVCVCLSVSVSFCFLPRLGPFLSVSLFLSCTFCLSLSLPL